MVLTCDADSHCEEGPSGSTTSTQVHPEAFTQPRLTPNPSNSIRRMLLRRLGTWPRSQASYRTAGTEASAAIDAGTSLRITSGYPPSGTVGKLYDLRCPLPCFGLFLAGLPITAAGSLPPYSWTMSAQPGSSLPPGLFFPDIQGYECIHIRPPAICGKPTTAGSYKVVITVKDSDAPAHRASSGYTITAFPCADGRLRLWLPRTSRRD